MRPRTRRTTALVCALACVWAVTAACSSNSSGTVASDDSLSNPWREWLTPDAACPVTLPMSPDIYPEALRDQEGKTTWYGDDQLWVDLGEFYSPARVGDAVVVKHAWWTVDSSGDATLEGGPPTVRATRLDGPGRGVATLRGHSDDGQSWWPAVLRFPEPGCWLVTGTRDDTVVRVVVKAG
jgi:hypothetical protein